MIKPEDGWYWYFDPKHDRMMLVISSQMVFRSRFSSKLLASDAFQTATFTVDDIRLFHLFDEQCCLLPINDTLRAELVLNGLVAQRFLKPVLPKSWYFTLQPSKIQVQQGTIIAVNVINSDETIFFMAVEVGETASLCVLAQPVCNLAGKKMFLGEALKVMNDRFIPVVSHQDSELKHFPLAM